MRLRQTRWLLFGLVGLAAIVTVSRQWPLRLVKVSGTSMVPTLLPGDRLVVVRRLGGVVPGDLVLAPDPRAPSRVLVKRVARVAGGSVDLAGEEPGASTDSRVFGSVPLGAVRERVVYRYYPPDRAGRLGRPARAVSDRRAAADRLACRPPGR